MLSFSFATPPHSKATTDHTLPTGNSKGSEKIFTSVSTLFVETVLSQILSAVIGFNAQFAMEHTRIPQAPLQCDSIIPSSVSSVETVA
jgi:hypothetical protein